MNAGQAAPALVAALAGLGFTTPSAAQDFRVRVSARAQSVSFRGWVVDSVPQSATTTVNGSVFGPDGRNVRCAGTSSYCTFFAPGPIQRSSPQVTSADAVFWGFGLPGLRARTSVRVASGLGGEPAWPGTSPAVQVVEAYAEYDRRLTTFRAGRTYETGRLGYVGYDGVNADLRLAGHHLHLRAFGGLGLAQGVALPVNSPVLAPLDEYQPRDRQQIYGATMSLFVEGVTARTTYQREIDPRANDFVSERAALDLAVELPGSFAFQGGAEYNIAEGRWGTADGALSFSERRRRLFVRAGARHYRPYFPLWTIWGAFSPASHNTLFGDVTIAPWRALDVQFSGQTYRYEDPTATSPLVVTRAAGWRWEARVRYHQPIWSLSVGRHEDVGPGAAAVGFDAAAAFDPDERIDVLVQAGRLSRPLEFRFSDATVTSAAVQTTYAATSSLRFSLSVQRFSETRDRPDVPSQWDQLRVALAVTTWFGKSETNRTLPPAVLRVPPRRVVP